MYSALVCETVERWVHLGEKGYPDGTRLIGHLPHRGIGAYLHRLYGPLEEELIQDLSIPNIDIHVSFYEFLSFHNGFDLFDGNLIAFGRRRSFDRVDLAIVECNPFDIFVPAVSNRDRSPSGHGLVISQYDDKSVIFIEPDGNIVRVGLEYQILNRWSGIRQWLEAEVMRLGGLFDEDGNPKVSSDELLPHPNQA